MCNFIRVTLGLTRTHLIYIYIYEMVNNIQLAGKLACMLRTYRTCNPIVRFPKYEFNNKLLGDVILLRVILDVT